MLPLALRPLLPLSSKVLPLLELSLPVIPLTTLQFLSPPAVVVAGTIAAAAVVGTIVVVVVVSIPDPNLVADSTRSIVLYCTGPTLPSMILLLTLFRRNAYSALLDLCLASTGSYLHPCPYHLCPFPFQMVRTFLLLGWCNPWLNGLGLCSYYSVHYLGQGSLGSDISAWGVPLLHNCGNPMAASRTCP